MYKGYLKLSNELISTNACIVTNNHRCGKSRCKCVQGYLHQSTALKYRENGKQKMKYVRKADVERVSRLLYSIKGLEIIDRGGDSYTFTIATLYPELSGTDIHIKAYEVFGQQKLRPASLTAN